VLKRCEGECSGAAGGGAVLRLISVGLRVLGIGGPDDEVTDERLVDVLHRSGVPALDGLAVAFEGAFGGIGLGEAGECGVAVAVPDDEVREIRFAGHESQVVRLGCHW
jgi:hypothetical protein